MNATLKWFYDVPGRRRGYVLVLAVLQAVTGFIGVFYALLLRNIVDSAVAKNGAAFWYNVFLIILLVVARLGLNALYRWIYELASSEIENCFKARLTHYILKKDYAAVTAIHSGEWMNRLTNDTVVAAKGFTDILPGLVGMLVRLVSALVMIILLDKWFACILIPGGIVLIFLTYAFRRVLKKLHKNIQEKDGVLRVFLQERTGNLMVLKSFTAEDQTEQEAKDLMADHKNARMKRNHFSNFCNIGFGAAMQGMYLMGAVYCAWGILTGRVTYGTMTAVMQLIGQVQAPFANITGYLPRIYAMTASAERLMEIETFPEDYSGTIEEIEEIRRFYEDGLAAFGLRDVSFRYNRENADKMPIVLKNLSLEIEKGEYIAFTGHSGCGKSTVLKLLMCMYPIEEGSRFLRSEDGEERELTSAYRRLFAYVPQGNALVSGTIREAVSLSDPSQADDEQRIREALRIACAEEFVDEQSEGIDTLLGERGTGLSEGQMQRIAIARAIFSGNPVLLLDEATSALDELTEAQLLRNLRRLTDKTVVIVTHRKAAFTICDRVIRFTEEGDIYPVDAGDNEPGIT